MNTRSFRIAPHANGQTAIFDDVGLVCTMEAGSQSKRDTDAAYIVELSAECQRLRALVQDAYDDPDSEILGEEWNDAARAALQEVMP